MGGELAGRVALVTGGGSGIGRAIALRFAEQGASVVVCGRRKEPLDEVVAATAEIVPDNPAVAVPADASREDDVDRLFAEIADRFGRLDVLVNNAGVPGAIGQLWEVSLEGWEETLGVNLTGPWLCSRAAARMMLPRRSGRIVNIGSVTGKRPLAGRGAYAASKLGLVALTRALALELGPHGITANNISPAGVDTERLAQLADAAGEPVDDLKGRWAGVAATGRISTPEDVAEAALFLASDRASNVNGVDLNVDGGLAFA